MSSMAQPAPIGRTNSTSPALLPEVAATAWAQADPSARFGFRMNTRLVALVLMSPLVLWTYFAYTAYRVGFSPSLLAFVVVYVAYTGWIGTVLLKWRAFAVRSAVIVTRGRLIWTHSGQVYQAKWTDIDPMKLGLQELTSERKLEFALRLRTVDGTREQLWLYRLYGLMDNLESFVQQLLERSSQGRVMINKGSLPTQAARAPKKISGSRASTKKKR